MDYDIAIIHKNPVTVFESLDPEGLKTQVVKGFLYEFSDCFYLCSAFSRTDYKITCNGGQVFYIEDQNIFCLFFESSLSRPDGFFSTF